MKLDSMYQEIILDHYSTRTTAGCASRSTPRCTTSTRPAATRSRCGCSSTAATIADVSYDGAGLLDQPGVASVMTDLVIGSDREALADQEVFLELMQSKGQLEPTRRGGRLEDAVAFAGVSKYPARVKCALLGWMAWKDATAQARDADEGSTA